jgi:hypothetical protein
MPPKRSKSDSSTKIGQTHETVINVHNFIKREAQEAKGQLPENLPTENPLKEQKSLEEGTKVPKGQLEEL